MLSWLVDDPFWVYAILGILTALCVWMWTRTRLGKFALGALIALMLIAGVVALQLLVTTDRKKIERSILEMSEGVKSQKMDRIFTNLAQDFRFGGMDRAAFRAKCEIVAKPPLVDQVDAWGFDDWEFSPDKKVAKLSFRAKPKGNLTGDKLFYLVKAEFVKEADSQWRMRKFEVFNPHVETKQPLQIPGF